MKNFIEIDIPLNGFQTDLLSGIIYSLGCLGIHEINQKRWRVYFTKDSTHDHALSLFLKLKELNPNLNKTDLVISEITSNDWNAEWKKYFKPIQPVKNIWIRPPWENLPHQGNGIELIIDPQMAFGTGHHETTTLMIKLMSQMFFQGVEILDVGTGSGILAILAAKLGAKSITAIDIDSDAIANADHNIELNKMSNINTKCCDLQSLKRDRFAVILANINYEILISSISQLRDFLKENGKLLISGILKEEKESIISVYLENGLKLNYAEDLREWSAMVWERVKIEQ
jgi:ribosomal protein L11 methyltransferase